ncbi:MAG: beta galactosidase jelly roll domain-containing protein [Chitinophagaceae bacterium]|jgi:signal transduction histidine kinase|nr:beta galactosidase jelly roll domain-containing protein [Chitinophagaceae bacterium]
MKKKLLLILFVFIFTSPLLIAQEKKDYFFLTDSMLKNLSWLNNMSLDINGNWKYHAGDSVFASDIWTKPDFDDNAWEKTQTTLNVDSLPGRGWNGIGWFRLHLLIDSSLLNKPLSLYVSQPGASEVYLNGKLFARFGEVGASKNNEVTLNTLTLIPPLIVFTQQENILAIRYSGFNVMQNRPPTVSALGFKLAIGKPDEVNKAMLEHGIFFKSLEALVIAIPLTFALIHFILFLFYRREKSNLYFALFALILALWGILEHESVGNPNAVFSLFLKRLWLPYLAIMPVVGLRFLYSLFYKKIPNSFWFFLFASVGIAIWSWFALVPILSLILFILSLAEMIRIVIVAMRKRTSGAWIIGVGFAAFSISLILILILIVTNNFSLTLWYILIYLTGVLPILLSMSVFLSQRIAFAYKSLESEIKKTLELRLENARKETELKKASELKAAYQALEEAHVNLQATQAQLIHSEKMASLGELTAGIAHEIQNPLNFVNNFSEVNKELLTEMKGEMDKGNFADVKEIVNDIIANEEKINHHGKRADGIVKSMLQHSRSSSGQKEPADINALCDEYLRLGYHGLRAKDKSFNAKFETDFDESIGKINVVAQDIGRVILNLITNAFYSVNEKRKSAGEGYHPSVTIKTKKMEKQVKITVRDNGNGIPQKARDKIFQPFFTTKPAGEGTGLGLSLSYDIVKAHGGEIFVDTREGQFTEFSILLPL